MHHYRYYAYNQYRLFVQRYKQNQPKPKIKKSVSDQKKKEMKQKERNNEKEKEKEIKSFQSIILITRFIVL